MKNGRQDRIAETLTDAYTRDEEFMKDWNKNGSL